MLPLDIGKAKWRFLAVSHAQTLWSLWLYLGCSAGGLCWAALEISAVKTQQAHPGMWGPRMCCKTRVWSCSEDSFIAIAKKIKADVIGFFGCNMTWCWTRASIYRRSVSQTMLMAVITCQGGVMINNCYNCMVMFACTFYNGFSGKKSHSTTNKSRFVSLEGKRNLTIDFGNITFHMKLTHFCSYIFIILVVLHRNAEIIIDSWNMLSWKRHLEASSSTSRDQLKRKEKLFWHQSTDKTTKKIRLNLSCKITILLIHFLLQCSDFHLSLCGST